MIRIQLTRRLAEGKSAAMKVQDLMTHEAHTCRATDPLEAAARTLWEKDCGWLPVVDGWGKLVGVLTDRDICIAAYFRGCAIRDIEVSSVMTRECKTCLPLDSVDDAEAILMDNQLRRLPVVETDGKLIGILTLADFARKAAMLRKKRRREVKDSRVGELFARISEARSLN